MRNGTALPESLADSHFDLMESHYTLNVVAVSSHQLLNKSARYRRMILVVCAPISTNVPCVATSSRPTTTTVLRNFRRSMVTEKQILSVD